MNISIINQELNHPKQYQIMVFDGFGFTHIFPGKLFTLEEAKTICNKNGFTINNIGNVWECLQ